jgi:putative effector of murein hydrolase
MKPATEELLQAFNPQGLFHGVMMSVAWVACQQLAIWALYFRNRSKIAIYIHAASMVTLLLLTSIATTQIIVYKGLQVITKTWFHTLLGMIVSCLVPIVLGFGFMAKVQ